MINRTKVINRIKWFLMLFIIAALFAFQVYYQIPSNVIIREGDALDFPPMITATADSGKARLKLLGILPIRTVSVNVVNVTELIPCGNSIGVRINIDGVMVVGISDFRDKDGKRIKPAQTAGIKPGDIIRKVNGEKVTKISDLSKTLESTDGQPVKMLIERNDEKMQVTVTPVWSQDDNTYKIGAWVRDGTSGIGTITFINPKNNTFGALGHGITDVDTGEIIPAGGGDLLYADIIGIKKGERGNPGELKGVFSGSKKIGNIKVNSEIGIYGTVETADFKHKPIPIALRSQIKTGKAYILSNIESDKVEKYDIEIQKVIKNSIGNKSMVIKITDSKLLEKTGGIVQGMSGSPIIQDGRLVGAITHVFINDPTRGYGTFIELMLGSTKFDE